MGMNYVGTIEAGRLFQLSSILKNGGPEEILLKRMSEHYQIFISEEVDLKEFRMSLWGMSEEMYKNFFGGR